MITHLEPDILEREVKWALESITMNKASGGDEIPAELFQIMKDDAVKVLHSTCLFIVGDWNAKVGSQEIPEVLGKFGLGIQNEIGQSLTEFCHKNALVIANTLFQQHKRRFYTWTLPDCHY